MPPTNYFVVIDWLDSTAATSGWSPMALALEEPPAVIRTVAILLRKPTKDDPFWIICRDVSSRTGTCAGAMRIPSGSVLRSKEIPWPKGLEM